MYGHDVAEEGIDATPAYVNVVSFNAGPFDLRIVFGYKGSNEAGADFAPVASVVMSYSHAKSMLPLLAKMIAAYENEFGEIPAPGFEEFGKM